MKLPKLSLWVLTGLLLAACIVLCKVTVQWMRHSWYSSTLPSVPSADIVFQTYVTGLQKDENGTIGFVNQDGSNLTLVKVASEGNVVHSPMINNGRAFFLIDSLPYVTYGGKLLTYQGGKARLCDLKLAWRPSRVGNTEEYVGRYFWRDDGGIVLFHLERQGCETEEFLSPHDMDTLEIKEATGFHTVEKVLAVGKHSYVYDLTTQQMHSFHLPPVDICRLSPSDDLLACLSQEGSHRVWVRIFRMKDGTVWRAHQIPQQYVPSFGVGDISWLPSGKELLYHRCVLPDSQRLHYCEKLGAKNVGIYLWNIETGAERLITTGGVFPYWIRWEDSP